MISFRQAVVKEGFSRYVPDDDYPGKHGVKEYAKRDDFNFLHHAAAQRRHNKYCALRWE
jgi:hypothetical protein